MGCPFHPEAESGLEACDRCGGSFCRDCYVVLGDRAYCAACKEEHVRDLRSGIRPGLLDLASIGRRLVGVWIDGFIGSMAAYVIVLPLTMVMFGVLGAVERRPGGDPPTAAVVAMMLVTYPIYFAVPIAYEGFMLQRSGQTLGKMALGVRVVTPQGGPISRRQAWTRAVAQGRCSRAASASLPGRPGDARTHLPARPDREDARCPGAVVSARCDAYPGVSCPHCGMPRDVRTIVSGRQSCPVCQRRFEAVRFDPPPRDATVPRLADAGPQGAHACPQHPGNASVANCGRCGVFLCALCRIEVDSRSLCPACFERFDEQGALPGLVTTFRDHSRVQSSLVLLGFVMPFVALVSGPGAVYYGALALRRLEASGEREGRAAAYVFSALGVLQTLGGVALVAWLVSL